MLQSVNETKASIGDRRSTLSYRPYESCDFTVKVKLSNLHKFGKYIKEIGKKSFT